MGIPRETKETFACIKMENKEPYRKAHERKKKRRYRKLYLQLEIKNTIVKKNQWNTQWYISHQKG